MNKLARKLVLSVLTVVLTVIALGTTTFAWFTLTNQAVVQPFNAQVVGDSGIEFALDNPQIANPQNLTWVTTLSPAAVTNYIADKYANTFRFNHVTTADGLNFFNITESGMVAVPQYFAGDGTDPAVYPGYLDINLHVRSNTVSTIKWTQVVMNSDLITDWNSDVAFTHTTGAVAVDDAVSVRAVDAMRIAVIGKVGTEENNVEVYENPAEGTNTVLTLNNADMTTGTNFAGAVSYYFAKTNAYPGNATAQNADPLIPARSVTTIATFTELVEDALDALSVTVLELDPDTSAGTVYYGTMTIRVWLEGWDAEAFNIILDQWITVGLTFEGIE